MQELHSNAVIAVDYSGFPLGIVLGQLFGP
jgi:hypothetical protein